MFRKIAFMFLLALLPAVSQAATCITEAGKPVDTVTDADIVGNVIWNSDTVRILSGFVYVENGESLTIGPGTVIKGLPGSGAAATALIVARGGQIFANGEPTCPIVFTGSIDNVDDTGDVPLGTFNTWGGIIVLGYARINTTSGVGQIEGIPVEEPRGAYGGNDDHDNSGVIKYVSIRHAGSNIGADNEINGLTMGAVGDGTEIHHVEVFNNLDDGFEWFGGTVNTSYLVSAFNGDDGFDYDEGFRGNGQFWFYITADGLGSGEGGEHDGGTVPEDGTPFAIPHIMNVTYIGAGSDVISASRAFNIRDNAGGKYYRSIFTEFPDVALSVEDLASGADSRQRLETGDLDFRCNLWWGWGAASDQMAYSDTASFVPQAFVKSALFANAAKDNMIRNPLLVSISRDADGNLDPRSRFCAGCIEDTLWSEFSGSFFTETNYMGAFDPKDSLWTDNWTHLWERNFTTTNNAPNWVHEAGKVVDTVTDADIVGDVVWTQDTVRVISGFVYVENGETLTIEPGTVIKALPGQGASASALIVARGGQIFANGQKTCPIIFTALSDNVDDTGDVAPGTVGQWGGVIILGNARINTTSGVGQIEGIPVEEPRGAYGGNDDSDNSGVFKYVSLRHGGSNIGADNEINGVTFGAVGSGTEVHHVEVYNNLDDGFEWFGGTVNTSYLVSAFNGDDGFDYDEGYRGRGQYWFYITEDGLGSGEGGEHDGGTVPEDGTPFAIPVISNVTYIGAGVDVITASRAFNIRDNAGGKYSNSIFTEFPDKALSVEDLVSGADSRQRLETHDLDFNSNYWWAWGIAADQVAFTDTSSYVNQTFVLDSLFRKSSRNNRIENPLLANVSREPDLTLDPRAQICPDWPIFPSQDTSGFIEETVYIGAFNPDSSLWTDCWTHLWDRGYTTRATAPGYDGGMCTRPPSTCCNLAGDADNGGSVNIGDVTFLISRIFAGGPAPACCAEGSADGSPAINIGDVTYLISRIFAGGPAPICGPTGMTCSPN